MSIVWKFEHNHPMLQLINKSPFPRLLKPYIVHCLWKVIKCQRATTSIWDEKRPHLVEHVDCGMPPLPLSYKPPILVQGFPYTCSTYPRIVIANKHHKLLTYSSSIEYREHLWKITLSQYKTSNLSTIVLERTIEKKTKLQSCPCDYKQWHVNPTMVALLINPITNQHQIVL